MSATASSSTRTSGRASPARTTLSPASSIVIVVSDLAWRRGLPWRSALAERWPGIRTIERVSIEGPRADALLLAGWLRSRLRRKVSLTRRDAIALVGIAVDGDPVTPPARPALSGSDLLSAELDTLARDPIYEAAVRETAA